MMKRIIPLIALLFLLSSHELFLKSTTYFLEENTETALFLLNGTFDESENIITRDRIVTASITGPAYSFKPENTDYYDHDDATFLRFKTGSAGTYLAGVSTKPRVLEMSAEDFTDYLEHEGLLRVLKDRKRKGIENERAIEQYAKHVKAILQVGEETTEDYAKPLHYPIEFIPLKNPYQLGVGDKMSFKLLYNGEPLPKQVVHISSRASATTTEGEEKQLKTNNKGEVSFKITDKGQWYIATIYMKDSDKEDIQYESEWATLTFGVK